MKFNNLIMDIWYKYSINVGTNIRLICQIINYAQLLQHLGYLVQIFDTLFKFYFYKFLLLYMEFWG